MRYSILIDPRRRAGEPERTRIDILVETCTVLLDRSSSAHSLRFAPINIDKQV